MSGVDIPSPGPREDAAPRAAAGKEGQERRYREAGGRGGLPPQGGAGPPPTEPGGVELGGVPASSLRSTVSA